LVTEFVNNLKGELASTFKDKISIYTGNPNVYFTMNCRQIAKGPLS
jgi:hypothetical protein